MHWLNWPKTMAADAPITLAGLLAHRPPGVRRQDAQDWLLFLLQKPRTQLHTHPQHGVDKAVQTRFLAGLARLSSGEPLAHLTGQQGFWGLDLQVTADTLIPRPDTERLVELALQNMTTPRGRALDLGTGSGAIALALASERPGWQVLALDCSAAALAVAEHNAQQHGLAAQVTFRASHWFDALVPTDGPFALVASNPPYLDANDVHLPQLRHEPRGALVAGEQGLADLRQVAQGARHWLTPGGWLLLEHGWTQGESVRALLHAAGYRHVRTERDYGGNERVTLGQWPAMGVDAAKPGPPVAGVHQAAV